MTSKLNLIKIRLINLDFGKRLKILRVFADVAIGVSSTARHRPHLISPLCSPHEWNWFAATSTCSLQVLI